MKNRILPLFFILVAAIAVSLMSWRDFHRAPRMQSVSEPPLTSGYYAGDGIEPSMVPDDGLPVTIALGDFQSSGKGGVTWNPHGMVSTTLPQRQVSLSFGFDSLPDDPEDALQTIRARLGEWQNKGNLVRDIVLDYHPATAADFKAYADFIAACHGDLGTNHRIVATVDPTRNKEELQALAQQVALFVIHLDHPHPTPEDMARMKAFEYPFLLRFPAGTRPADVDQKAFKGLAMLSGIVFALDPHNPWPKQEETIGLWPKF